MPYFTHRFDTRIELHPVGRYHYTVVYLDPGLKPDLPLAEHPRLRIEADVSGVSFKGAWQPAGGRWYLMLPKVPLRKAGLGPGSAVEVAFRLIDPDDVDIPSELQQALASSQTDRAAWEHLTAGQQRGLSHWIASARQPATRARRLADVQAALRGTAPFPWSRRGSAG